MSRMIKVWDVPTRLFHWTMLPVFAGLWFTGEQGGDWMGVRDYRVRLAGAGLTRAICRVLTLEPGATDKLVQVITLKFKLES